MRRIWARFRGYLAELPFPLAAFVAGLTGGGLVGAVAGLVVGLIAYPPTAWAAVVELGLPAALVCGVLGLTVGAAAVVGRRLGELWRGSRRPH